jgi:predicted Na+-dependent transporter
VYALAPALAIGASWVGLGGLENGAATELRIGIFLVTLMPVAMTATVWVRLATGNVALLLALVAVTTTLSVVTVPLYSHLLPSPSHQAFVSVPVEALARQLVLSVVIPLGGGLAARRWASRWADRAQPTLSLLGTLSFLGALSTNVAGASDHLAADIGLVAVAGAVTVGLNGVFFALTILGARSLRARNPGLSHDDAVALLYGGAMRSTGTAMVLGAAAYPGMPLVTVPAAITSSSQQILGAYLSRALGPGAALLQTPVSVGRAALDAYVRKLGPKGASRLALIVFSVASEADGQPVSVAGLMSTVRRRLRGHDHVSVLAGDRFAVLIADVPEAVASKIAKRLHDALCASVPQLSVRWAVSEAGTPCHPSRLVELAFERAMGAPDVTGRLVS